MFLETESLDVKLMLERCLDLGFPFSYAAALTTGMLAKQCA